MYLRLAPYSQEWLWTSNPPAFTPQLLDSRHLFPRLVVLGTEPSASWVLGKHSTNRATSQWKPDPASASYRLCGLEGVAPIILKFCHLGSKCNSNKPSSHSIIGIEYIHLSQLACFYIEHRTQTEKCPFELFKNFPEKNTYFWQHFNHWDWPWRGLVMRVQ